MLVLLTALRFYRRIGQERRRQEVITWPRATAVLDGEEDGLLLQGSDDNGNPLYYHGRLLRDYVFYARGERQTGNRLAPGLDRINAGEGKALLRALAKHRRYEVVYNPDDPTENFLTVGPPLLGNWHLLLYAFTGLLVPGLLLLGGTAGMAGAVAMGIVLGTLVMVSLYYTVQPILDLRKYLQPTPEVAAAPDELLASINAAAERRKVEAGATPVEGLRQNARR